MSEYGSAHPSGVRQMTATELSQLRQSGEPFELVDVRTEMEREMACIDGSRLLDKAYGDHLLTLDRSTLLVFQCHHGIRSQSAAEYCIREGFTNVSNVVGGIDAWSLLVDPTVPRY